MEKKKKGKRPPPVREGGRQVLQVRLKEAVVELGGAQRRRRVREGRRRPDRRLRQDPWKNAIRPFGTESKDDAREKSKGHKERR